MSEGTTGTDPGPARRISVVNELENAGLAGRHRAADALDALAGQLEAATPDAVASAELLIAFDPEEMPADLAREIVDASGVERAVEEVRYLARPGADYFALKNEGAREAGGDPVLFLDSDVIPEEGWLRALLGALDDPDAEVVGSHCYIEGEDLASRAYALFGPFPLRGEDRSRAPVAGIFLNSLAARERVVREHPFPDLPLHRNSAHLWRKSLRRAGVDLRRVTEARVAHPAPPGVGVLLRRSLADGHDHYASRRAEGHGVARSLAEGLGACALRTVRKTPRTLLKGPSVGLGPLGTAAATGLCLLCHAARAAGCMASFARGGRLPDPGAGWLSLRAS